MTRAPLASLALALACLAGAGCHEPVTEVVLVLDSDLAVPADADTIQVTGDFESPLGINEIAGTPAALEGFPLSVAFVSTGAQTPGFSVTINLDKNNAFSVQPIVLRRTVMDVAFVKDETRMLVVTLSKACACQGTSCPNPGNPACDDIMSPETEPFDPARAPPSQMGPAFTVGGPDSGAPTPRPIDAGSGVILFDAGSRDAFATDLGPDLVGRAEGGTTDGAATDGGPTDGAATDGGPTDGARDGATPDGAAPEAGPADGGAPEVGASDAGVVDGAADGGGGEAGVD